MINNTSIAIVVLVFAAMVTTEVLGHGTLTQPKPEILKQVITDGLQNGPSDMAAWDGKSKDLTSLAKKKCGHTKEDSSPQPIPSTMIYGVTTPHPGPCALYLNGQQTEYQEKCKFRMPIDASKCGSSCKLQFVWVATHQGKQNSEIYAYCANLSGSGKSGGKDGKNGRETSTEAPVTKDGKDGRGTSTKTSNKTSTETPVTKPDQTMPNTSQPGDNGENPKPRITDKAEKSGEVTNAPDSTGMPDASGKPKMKTKCRRRLRSD